MRRNVDSTLLTVLDLIINLQVLMCIFRVFFSLSFISIIDPSEVKLLKKECFNRWYSLMPYYTALTLSRIPFQVNHFTLNISSDLAIVIFFLMLFTNKEKS